MVFLTLGNRFGIDDRGAPGATSGWGNPSWGLKRVQMGMVGPMKPIKVGARYFCGDCGDGTEPIAGGNKYTSSKAEYQAAVQAHYDEEHKDLHYPLDPVKVASAAAKAKAKQRAFIRSYQEAVIKMAEAGISPIKGGIDVSGVYRPVTRPRELADFTEFDFPDANLADGAAEEIELDQLISIAARQGRRLLGVELQGLATQLGAEFLTVNSVDHDMFYTAELNTRTGGHNLDDPENLWRKSWRIISTDAEPASAMMHLDLEEQADVPPGGVVYVAPRLFFRQTNDIDAQINAGGQFARIATISQPLSTFLLFELLEQFSGLFGFAA